MISLENQNKRKQKKDEEVDEENDNNIQREFDSGILEEVDEINENEDRQNNMMDHLDMELDEFSTETADNSAEEENNASEEFPGIPGVNEISDNSAEPLEEVHIHRHLYDFCILFRNCFSVFLIS